MRRLPPASHAVSDGSEVSSGAPSPRALDFDAGEAAAPAPAVAAEESLQQVRQPTMLRQPLRSSTGCPDLQAPDQLVKSCIVPQGMAMRNYVEDAAAARFAGVNQVL